MTIDLTALEGAPRLLLTAPLQPLQGSRFQPTGFPDLGAAEFEAIRRDSEGNAFSVNALLVESAQSMANRLENVCWDEGAADLVPELQGLPYVRSTLPDQAVTNSILEAHRLNSPYIVHSDKFPQIVSAIGYEKGMPFDRRRLASALLQYDPSSLLHGVFLEKVGGVVRLPRVLSAFVEAENIRVASNGGVKFDRVQPDTGENTQYGKANEGFGNVPFHRDEYTAETINAFFNIDLALLRGYGLAEEAQRLLILLSLFKIRKFLEFGLRLRTACDLELINEVIIKRPQHFSLPTLPELEQALPDAIRASASHFASPAVTEVTYKAKQAGKAKKK